MVEYYADDGYSGTNFNRPEFKRMMGDIEMGKINLVLTKDLSRLGRNHILTGQYTDIIFPQYDVRYIAVGDGVDTLYDDNDIAPFKNVLNEMYARDISKKQRASMANRRANGLFTGNLPPYGYLIDPEKKHRFIVDETAAKVVRHIFDLALQGYGGRAIGPLLRTKRCCVPPITTLRSVLNAERFRQKNISGMSRPSAKCCTIPPTPELWSATNDRPCPSN